VTTRREEEGHFGLGEQVDFESRTPWRHVVAFGPDCEDWNANIGERHSLATRDKPSFG